LRRLAGATIPEDEKKRTEKLPAEWGARMGVEQL